MWSMSARDQVFLALILFSLASLMQLLYRLRTPSALSAGFLVCVELMEVILDSGSLVDPLVESSASSSASVNVLRFGLKGSNAWLARDTVDVDLRYRGCIATASASHLTRCRGIPSGSRTHLRDTSDACLASLLRSFSRLSLFGVSRPTGAGAGDLSGVLFFDLPLLAGVLFSSPRTPMVSLLPARLSGGGESGEPKRWLSTRFCEVQRRRRRWVGTRRAPVPLLDRPWAVSELSGAGSRALAGMARRVSRGFFPSRGE